jgi:hypothetical protein
VFHQRVRVEVRPDRRLDKAFLVCLGKTTQWIFVYWGIIVGINQLECLGQVEETRVQVLISHVPDSKLIRVNDLVLRAGSEALLELTLVNETDTLIVFDDLSTSCACSKPEVTATKLESHKPIKVRLKWKVPVSSPEGITQTSISFFDQKSLCLRLDVAATVSHSLFVGAPGLGKRGQDGVVVWKVPVSWTDPINFEELNVKLDETLGDVSAKLEVLVPHANDPPKSALHRGVVVLSAPKVVADRGDLFGVIVVSHGASGVTTERAATLSVNKVIKVSPEVFRFRPMVDNESFVDANGILQLDRSFFQNTDDQEIKVEITAEVEGQVVDVSSKHIGNQVYRISLRLHADIFEHRKEVEYLIRVRNGEREFHARGSGVIE